VTAYTLGPVELRVLGCLIEKQRTTPEQYPLSLNALRLACNQSTAREPVVAYEEAQVRDAVHRLGQMGFARLASGPGSRVAKYRHLADEALDLDDAALALLALLILRGPQTAAELKTRSERLHPFATLANVTAALERLDERELAHILPRRPGQREERWTQLLADAPSEPEAPLEGEPTSLERRVARLEEQLEELQRLLAERGLLD
jgi:uncharacterized protein YceH (UPF0502 family)